MAHALAFDLRGDMGEFVEVGKQHLGFPAQFRHDRAEQDRATHGRQRVFRPHEDRGWRADAEPLKGAEYLCQQIAPLGERRTQHALLVAQAGEPGVRCLDIVGEPPFGGCGINEGGRDRGAVLAQRLDLLGKLVDAFVGCLEFALQALALGRRFLALQFQRRRILLRISRREAGAGQRKPQRHVPQDGESAGYGGSPFAPIVPGRR